MSCVRIKTSLHIIGDPLTIESSSSTHFTMFIFYTDISIVVLFPSLKSYRFVREITTTTLAVIIFYYPVAGNQARDHFLHRESTGPNRRSW